MPVVDPSAFIHHVFKPFFVSLYQLTLASSGLMIHMIQLAVKPERSTTQPTMQSQAQSPIFLLARLQPEPSQLTLQ